MTVTVTAGEPDITERVPMGGVDWHAGWEGAKEVTGWNWLWGTSEDYYNKAVETYAKSDLSAAVDTGLAKAQEIEAPIAAGAKNWLGYASDPSKIQATLQTVMVIVIVLGIVYVLATVAPLLRPIAR